MTLEAHKRELSPQQQLEELTKGSKLGQRLIQMRRESWLELHTLGVSIPLSLDDDSIKNEIVREITCGIRGTILIL